MGYAAADEIMEHYADGLCKLAKEECAEHGWKGWKHGLGQQSAGEVLEHRKLGYAAGFGKQMTRTIWSMDGKVARLAICQGVVENNQKGWEHGLGQQSGEEHVEYSQKGAYARTGNVELRCGLVGANMDEWDE